MKTRNPLLQFLPLMIAGVAFAGVIAIAFREIAARDEEIARLRTELEKAQKENIEHRTSNIEERKEKP